MYKSNKNRKSNIAKGNKQMPSPHLDNDAINLLRDKLDIVFNRNAFDILIDSNGHDEVVRQLLILKQKFRNGIDKGFIPQTFRSTDYGIRAGKPMVLIIG